MEEAISEVKALMSNKIVMDFCRKEALELVAKEMQAKGYTCTAKGVDLLSQTKKNIKDRVDQYVAIALIGCLMAKHKI